MLIKSPRITGDLLFFVRFSRLWVWENFLVPISVKYGICYISAKNGLIATKRNTNISIELQASNVAMAMNNEVEDQTDSDRSDFRCRRTVDSSVYTPRTTKWLGVYWFHSVRPSVCPSARPSRIPCPLCSAYSSGGIHFIFTHPIKQLQMCCV